MTETATESALARLHRATDVLARAQDDAANGWGTAADIRRATEDRDAALRAYEHGATAGGTQ